MTATPAIATARTVCGSLRSNAAALRVPSKSALALAGRACSGGQSTQTDTRRRRRCTGKATSAQTGLMVVPGTTAEARRNDCCARLSTPARVVDDASSPARQPLHLASTAHQPAPAAVRRRHASGATECAGGGRAARQAAISSCAGRVAMGGGIALEGAAAVGTGEIARSADSTFQRAIASDAVASTRERCRASAGLPGSAIIGTRRTA